MFGRPFIQPFRFYCTQNGSAEIIFSSSSKVSFLEKANKMKSVYPSTKKMEKRAAVLIPLVSVEGEASLLFTARSRQLRHHRGEICYPGGKFDDKSDTTIQDAALRETVFYCLIINIDHHYLYIYVYLYYARKKNWEFQGNYSMSGQNFHHCLLEMEKQLSHQLWLCSRCYIIILHHFKLIRRGGHYISLLCPTGTI